jgi:hypothetical protein
MRAGWRRVDLTPRGGPRSFSHKQNDDDEGCPVTSAPVCPFSPSGWLHNADEACSKITRGTLDGRNSTPRLLRPTRTIVLDDGRRGYQNREESLG